MAFDHYEPCPRCVDAGRDRRGDNLAVYDDGGSHCFSCGYHRGVRGFHGSPLASNLADRNLADLVDDPKVLPADFSREVPAKGWEWLLQYGLSWKYWTPFVGWSESSQRLVFTVGEPTTFSMGRFLGRPEAFDRPPRKWFVWGNSHRSAHIVGENTTGTTTVLVEDLISAHKVGQVTPCIPLFGTKVFDAVLPAIRYLNHPVVMWLDKDQDHASAKRAAWLSVVSGLSVSYASTEQDPKSLSLSKIGQIVNLKQTTN